MRKKQSILPLLFLLLSGLLSAQAKQVTVTGEGISRDEAINDALRRAVEQVLGTLVESETVVENYQVIEDRIYTKARGYVTDWQELEDERRVSNGIVTVKITANVDTRPNSDLVRDMSSLMEEIISHGLGDPRIAVVVSEKYRRGNVRTCVYDSSAETAIINKLREAGFSNIMDKNQIDFIRDRDIQTALMNGDRNTANAMKTRFDVDYIIVGEAFSEFMGRPSNDATSCSAALEARLIGTDTGRIGAIENFKTDRGEAAFSESAAAQRALRSVGERMGDHLVGELLKSGQKIERTINLTVTGITNFSRVTEIQRALSGIRGVNNVRSRGYNGGVATFEIQATVLAITLASRINDMSAPRLYVMELSDGTIKAAM